jgi:hypothetical protein
MHPFNPTQPKKNGAPRDAVFLSCLDLTRFYFFGAAAGAIAGAAAGAAAGAGIDAFM